jgi:hypothetical protein
MTDIDLTCVAFFFTFFSPWKMARRISDFYHCSIWMDMVFSLWRDDGIQALAALGDIEGQPGYTSNLFCTLLWVGGWMTGFTEGIK